MKTIEEKYNIIKQEVEFYAFLLKKIPEISEIYKGTQILFSPLVYRPKFMLMGFNPSDGYYRKTGQIVEKFEPENQSENQSESIDDGYRFLREETNSLFKMTYCDEALKNAVKTNCVFFATETESQFWQLLENRVLRKYAIYEESCKWIRKLIEMVEPEIIICENKNVFNILSIDIRAKTESLCYIIDYKKHNSIISEKAKLASAIKGIVVRTDNDTFLSDGIPNCWIWY